MEGGVEQVVAGERGRGNGLGAAGRAKGEGRGLWRGAQSAMAGGKPDWRQTLYELACPKCYVFGERTLPHEDAEELPKRGVAIRILPKTGHSMTWENPTGLARAIEEAIAD